MEIEDLNIQPVTAFKVAGNHLMLIYPSIFHGFVNVFCGESKKPGTVLVVHDCMLCQGYGHRRCPYIKKGIKNFMVYREKRFSSYDILKKMMPVKLIWEQIPVSDVQVERKEGAGYEFTT